MADDGRDANSRVDETVRASMQVKEEEMRDPESARRPVVSKDRSVNHEII